MFHEIIVLLWLAVLPAILWAIPKTRRMTGSWITALKTVPLGCLTIWLLLLHDILAAQACFT